MSINRFGLSSSILKRVQTWFISYTKGFEAKEPRSGDMMALKIRHTHRVRRAVLDIGGELGLEPRELNLADMTALLHDIGRFEQYERYRTFSDRLSVNHALLGVDVCRREHILHDLDEETASLILRVISYHNLAAVPMDETPPCLFYSRLLRDADKLDIWNVVLQSYESPKKEQQSALFFDLPDLPNISNAVIESIRSGAIANVGDMRTLNDFKLMHMSWVFDINFRRTFEIIQERRYVERLRDSLEDRETAEDVYRRVNRHCRRRITGEECSMERGKDSE